MKRTELKRKTPLARVATTERTTPRRPVHRETGFSRQVKLAVRKRAAGSPGSPGDPEDACCEGCGVWLGPKKGQVHHRLARQAGGCKLAVVNSSANALLLCGTPEDKSTCHGLATAWDERTLYAGFVLEHGNDPMRHDPRYVPILWNALGSSGVLLWLGENGEYLRAEPESSAA